ncbi:insulinase family protein [bacterium]|nr:insulinase family protein [bacterium]
MIKTFDLDNNLSAVYKNSPNTPRIAVTLNMAVDKPERCAGIYSLINRLLSQGTSNRSAEQIANELDENAIEFYSDSKQDYFRLRMICLNEDFEKMMELLADIVKNTTFEDFDKEKVKMQGEITADLDSARIKAQDNFIRTLFDGHYYGNTLTKILENIDNITKDDVINSYKQILSSGEKFMAVVGDIPFETVQKSVADNFGDIPYLGKSECEFATPVLEKSKRSDIIKKDANQAQIYQGWIVPGYESEDYAPLVVFNNILGSSGLSSRLFVNLRDKKGLAYTVRSSYEMYKVCGNFCIYIATEPSNIQISLDGFMDEIAKLQDELVSETELKNAKNNIIGKQQFITETNIQRSNQLAYYAAMHLGYDYQEKFIDLIRNVTAEDVQRVAKKHFVQDSVISVLRP